MQLLESQMQQYHRDGFLLIESVFDDTCMQMALREMNNVIARDCENRILEKSGVVRSFFSPETYSAYFENLVQLESLVKPAMQLLGADVYVHQTKLNTKFALAGDWWEWHQDYTFWKNDDGMPKPDVLTAMIFLNDVTEFNGPLLLIPGSHEIGSVDTGVKEGREKDSWYASYRNSTSYMSALTSDLKYTLSQQEIAHWVSQRGLQSAKGPAGSVLFFHGNVFHASSNNMSPWDRHTFLITYNSLNNKLADMEAPRPAFLANREFKKVIPRNDQLIYS